MVSGEGVDLCKKIICQLEGFGKVLLILSKILYHTLFQ